MNKYYATYEGIGHSDIAMFESEKKRDEWVSFQDPFSKSLGSNSDNATFQRCAIDNEEAKRLINRYRNVFPVKDDFDSELTWYIFSRNLAM